MTNADSRCNKDVCCNPGFVFNDYWLFEHFERRTFHIVTSGAHVRALGDDDVTADLNFPQTVQSHVIADPGKISDGNFPGICDVDGRAK